jgi:ethanolamine utilization protein EutP (predicted NTPase)
LCRKLSLTKQLQYQQRFFKENQPVSFKNEKDKNLIEEYVDNRNNDRVIYYNELERRFTQVS